MPPRSPQPQDLFSLLKLKFRRQQIFVNLPRPGLSVHLGCHHAHIQRSVLNQQCERVQSIWTPQDFCESLAALVEGQHLSLQKPSNINCSTVSYKQVREERPALSWEFLFRPNTYIGTCMSIEHIYMRLQGSRGI